MVKKICPDCHREFECTTSQKRCNICQDSYRRRYIKQYAQKWWNDKPSSATRYYQFWKFCESITDDEIRALIQSYRTRMNEKKADIQELRTKIKILTQVYKDRDEERKENQDKWQYEDIERNNIIEGGTNDESE
jgi:threonine synthase